MGAADLRALREGERIAISRCGSGAADVRSVEAVGVGQQGHVLVQEVFEPLPAVLQVPPALVLAELAQVAVRPAVAAQPDAQVS
jgi:hypothetical protein